MKALIVEDEFHNYRLLKGMIHQIRPQWKVEGPFESIEKTVNRLENDDTSPELIFMDIQLLDGNCFSIFEKTVVESMVIFTTAFDEFALKAFKVNSIDYILKPVKQKELESAIVKFENLVNISKSKTMPDYSELLKALKPNTKTFKKRFLISGPTAFSKVDTKDVAMFYTENRISRLVTFDGKEHPIELSMENLEKELDPEMFFRANRSTIISCDAIQKFENYFGGKLIIMLTPPIKHKVYISRLKSTEFKKWLGK